MASIATAIRNEEMSDAALARAAVKPFHSLPAYYYLSEERCSRDLDVFFQTQWIYAGHISQLPRTGSYFLFEIGKESIIVTRNAEGAVKAFFNVCTHRGTRLCTQQAAEASRIICPYHAWTYDLDGQLVGAPEMSEGFDRSEFPLVPVNVGVFDGFIFLNLNRHGAPDFNMFCERFGEFTRDFDLANAKVVAVDSEVWEVNWKLAIENYIEYYHFAAHPSYAKVHVVGAMGDYGVGMAGAGGGGGWLARMGELGRLIDDCFVDGAGTPYMQFAQQLEVGFGNATGSVDGKMKAPLLGNLKEIDGSWTYIHFNPFTPIIIYNDQATIFSFVPDSAGRTRYQMAWLVRGDAVEGRDYDVEELTKMWRVTMAEDKILSEDNQAGVRSSVYKPGPYSLKEKRLIDFVDWYLRHFVDEV